MKKIAFVALALLAGCNMWANNKTVDSVSNTGEKQIVQKTISSWNVASWYNNTWYNNNWNVNLKSSQKIMKTNSNNVLTAKNGNTVLVDYVGFFPDGKVFDTSIESVAKENGIYNAARNYKPLEFQLWAGRMIPCFEKAVEWMKVGETKEVTCEPKDAYGECDPKNYIKVPKSQLVEFEKAGYKLEKWVELPTQYGMKKIVDVDNETVTLDFNNPMCGKTLKFKITLKRIKEQK